ncbi:MAG TPA: PilN domain-containing protein [Actinomycetales bacterium]|nr:PilN domain-containing protein [Actinomycetales bacterium]
MSLITSDNDLSEAIGQAGTRSPRVNLLPPEILQARRLRRTKVGLAAGLVVVVGAIGGAYVTQVNAKNRAQDDLNTAQAQGARLQAEQAKYADVPRTMAAIDRAETTRQTAMANDIEWFRTLTNVSITLPSKVWLTSLTLQVNGGTATGPAGTTPLAGGVGSVSAVGTAMDHPDVATWLDVLGHQPGMSDAYFSSSKKKEIGSASVVDFSSTATVTDDALSHRYDRKQG